MESFLSYIKERYHPVGIIVYGSFANGTNEQGSDFDALVITESGSTAHDDSVCEGTRLDVFIYPKSYFESDFDLQEFIQLLDGVVVMDTDGIASDVKNRVTAYYSSLLVKNDEEKRHSLQWCRKMLERAKRGDMEGKYRLHWLLVDSLEIYSDLRGWIYLGPKKTLVRMERMDPAAAERYEVALTNCTITSTEDWIDSLFTML